LDSGFHRHAGKETLQTQVFRIAPVPAISVSCARHRRGDSPSIKPDIRREHGICVLVNKFSIRLFSPCA
jgi:hypothetical protein